MSTRRVIVTGASRGLGLGIARTLVGAGFGVIAIARRDTPALAQLAAESAPGALEFVAYDLQETEGLPTLVRDLRRQFGGFYGLVNNAAIGTSGVLANMQDRSVEELIRLNTLSPILLTKHVVRSMLAANEGRIVNIASIIAFTGYSGLSAYAATKASMIGFTRSLAREVGRVGINVNAIAPGFIETELTQEMSEADRAKIASRSALQRLASIDDVANSVAFLLSDAARSITGTVLTVDAGNTA